MIRQVFYLSEAAACITTGTLQQILHLSVRNNRRADVTGCLLFTGSHFAQILEGRSLSVDVTLRRIRLDSRHKTLRILADKHVEKRAYGEWAMGSLYDLSLDEEMTRLLGDARPSDVSIDAAAARLCGKELMLQMR